MTKTTITHKFKTGDFVCSINGIHLGCVKAVVFRTDCKSVMYDVNVIGGFNRGSQLTRFDEFELKLRPERRDG